MSIKPTILAMMALIGMFFSASAQTKLSVQAGFNFTNVSYTLGDKKQDPEAIPRFQVGLAADIPMLADFYLQTGLAYVGRGFKQQGGWAAEEHDMFETKVHYLEVPVAIAYKPNLGIGRLLLSAGPYLGYGLGGKWKTDGSIIMGDIIYDRTKDKVIFKKDAKDAEFGNYLYGKPLDMGLTFGIGFEFLEKFTAKLQLQQGIRDIYPDEGGKDGYGSKYNKSYGFVVGYTLF